MNILVAGGHEDPNLQRLMDMARSLDIAITPLLTDSNASPAFSWSLINDNLQILQAPSEICAAFVRRNVFHEPSASNVDRSSAWYNSVMGYLSTHPDIKMLNRSYLGSITNKPHILYMANDLGFNIPQTIITNVPDDFPDSHPISAIAKPVMGGGYCEEVDQLMGSTEFRASVAASPAIVQQQVRGADIRIFRIHEQFIGFKIRSENLDYRKDKKPEISCLADLPGKVISLLEKLMDKMGLNWGSADFKQDEQSGKYYFLEVNSNPMFAVFDRISHGQISKAILNFLTV